MNTITLSNSTIKNAEEYARLHNISVTEAIEKAVRLLLGKLQPSLDEEKTSDYEKALAYVKSLKATGGEPVPSDENGLEALVSEKGYKLFFGEGYARGWWGRRGSRRR